jgi:hypothetical protein
MSAAGATDIPIYALLVQLPNGSLRRAASYPAALDSHSEEKITKIFA